MNRFHKNNIVLTCEHATNDIPVEYEALFLNASAVLDTHRGYDIGAKRIAQTMSVAYALSYVEGKHSRLLIDLNRSLHNRSLFSEFTRALSPPQKKQIIDNIYLPHFNQVETSLQDVLKKQATVCHLAIHSFTPCLNGISRDCDIGLLYDPSSELEKTIAQELKQYLEKNSQYKIRFNYPYRGTADCIAKSFRKKYSVDQYAGIEIEVNQKLLLDKFQIENITKLFQQLL